MHLTTLLPHLSRSHDAHLQSATIDRHDVYRDSTRIYNSSGMRLDTEVHDVLYVERDS